MTTSAASSRVETYTKEQLLYFYGIVNILLIYVYNIATVGWQLVHYTVYGTKKSDNGLGFASSIIAFLRPVNCIVDSPPSNICIMLRCFPPLNGHHGRHIIYIYIYVNRRTLPHPGKKTYQGDNVRALVQSQR